MKRTLLWRSGLCSQSKGYTLTELSFVLLIAAVILGAVWVAAAHTWDNYRTARAVQQLTKATQNIREYYINAQSLPGPLGNDDTKAMDAANLFPVEMRRNASAAGNTAIDHPLNGNLANGSLHVETQTCPSGTTLAFTCFRVRMEGLSSGACVRLLEAVPVNDTDLGILKVGAQDMGVSTVLLSSQIKTDTAQVWCNVAGANNEVDWDFKLHN